MTKFKISSSRKLPEGVKLAKSSRKVKPSDNEYYPLTRLQVGQSFYVPGYTARDLRGVIHSKKRTRGMKFVSETEYSRTGSVKGAAVFRIK